MPENLTEGPVSTHRFRTADGVQLAVHTLGEGRPVVLLHGFLSSAERNWFAPGVTQALAAAGYRVIAPDCRGHGASDAPEDLAHWPPDVMAADVEALVAHLGLADGAWDLAGYSMGGRTAARVMVRSLRPRRCVPRRCVLGGMGDFGIMAAGPRAEAFEDAIRHGEAAADPAMGRGIHRMMAAQGLKPAAMLGVLAAFAPTTEAELAAIPTPTLAILGDQDHDNGSVEVLARIMPACTPLTLPGDHGSVVATAAFREALVGFLAQP
jgi:pimeloyl-ACP methyl ester carboxylesterase